MPEPQAGPLFYQGQVTGLDDVMFGDPVSDDWPCDIRYLLRQGLKRQKSQLSTEALPNLAGGAGFPLADPYLFHAPDQKSTLEPLIREDLISLSSSFFWRNWVGNVGPIKLIERFSPDPNAQIICTSEAGQEIFSLVFHSPIIWFINNISILFYSSASFLEYKEKCENTNKRTAGVYGENVLWISSFIKTLEQLRTKEALNLEQDNPVVYLGSAFDLCQRVDGARRFIVAHEIGHVCLFSNKACTINLKRWIDKELGTLVPDLAKVPEASRENWLTEFWCDVFGVMVIFMGLLEEYKKLSNGVIRALFGLQMKS